MADVKQVQMMNLLNAAAIGAVVIPDFQRDFVWKTKLLLESSIDNLRFAPMLICGVDQIITGSQKPTTVTNCKHFHKTLYWQYWIRARKIACRFVVCLNRITD